MEEDLFVSEFNVSASEDEQEESDSKRKHQKLLDAVSSLSGKKRRRLAERTEASLHVSEFGISTEGAGEKISLSDLIEPIKPTTSLSKVKKQLKSLKNKKSVELPLSNEETQKIQRVISYQNASQEVAKWDPVVKQNRKAEQLVFPLADETLKPAPIEDKLSGWKPHTPLEMEIFNILHDNKQPITDPLLTPMEEASLKAMSLDEAMLRRAELRKARALQSYYEAKARRERKIKSKKYHKLLKKGKQKKAIKEFEELRKTNPEAALEELEKLEKTRMEERMTLKHQNSGKWAKSKAIMAKYDEESRKAMQEQLQRNKELTHKIKALSESEESEEEETVPDFVNDAQVISEGPNPWMTGKLRSDAKDSGSLEEEEKAEEELNTKGEDEKEESEEEQESEEEVLLREFEDRRHLRKQAEQETPDKEPGTAQEPTTDVVQEAEETQVSQFNRLFQKLMDQNRVEEQQEKRRPVPKPEEPLEDDSEEELEKAEEEEEEGPLLMESTERRQSMESVEALAQEEEIDEPTTRKKNPRKKKSEERSVQPTGDKPESKLIDRDDVLPVKSPKVQMPLLPTTVEEEEEEDDETAQKMIIQEAFAGDDVIKDFLNEKKKNEQDGKPKDINLVLPGWGEWGGTNLKVSHKKRSRFIIKGHRAPPRKDQRLPNVIINETRNIMAAAHQVNELPYPFNNQRHFESSIRAPLGKTWNTEKAAHKLNSPRVITKKGHIIEPITEDIFQKHTQATKTDMEREKPNPKQDQKDSRKRKSRPR